MFQFIESRHGFDMYLASYNGENYVIQYEPSSDTIRQMRPYTESSSTVSRLFQSYISSAQNNPPQ
ncbi:hypothetical protein SAMN05192534_106158 [Alteribacillus persepolensis]|uniref:Uncharacterized protein n=1 Tax=Alteribacillus persepolensis TaxID=568899 RepID=A0A1G8D1J3_9BACI|nr:hypothetical protein [Alteribacillus persepolensis]SDH51635.1 hypothetical protein SAMN05192534_106158 [Alteribacillus persepolensis]